MTKKNKTKKLPSRNKTQNWGRLRLEALVQQQADELKIKNGQQLFQRQNFPRETAKS